MVLRENYLQIRLFLDGLREAQRLSPETVSRYWFYARHLLLWAGEEPLGRAHLIRPSFAAYLGEFRHGRDRLPLTPADMKKIAQVARRVLTWLKSSYASDYQDMPASWIGTVQPPRGSEVSREPVYVTLQEALTLGSVQVAPANLALRRDRAASALLFLSGMRAGALCTLPIGCLDLGRGAVGQFPEMGVKTKNRKSAETYLLPIPELIEIARDWDDLVRRELPATAAWYAPVISSWGEQRLSAQPPGANRNTALQRRMPGLFAHAGLAYKSPHKFRHGTAVYGLQHARTMADYKAVSMNLMHGDIRITHGIYAILNKEDVRARIASLSSPDQKGKEGHVDLHTLVKTLSREELADVLSAIVEQIIK
jgi:integrase